jgi:hypothetical protein
MNFAEHHAELLAHYVTLAKIPGFKAHAWHRVQELARLHPVLYGELPRLVTEAMNKAKP